MHIYAALVASLAADTRLSRLGEVAHLLTLLRRLGVMARTGEVQQGRG